ncbi:MAG TPA: hypothetical protein VN452_00130 [Longilinea sp.]|nr:hypothetical protein [Longilinea sp.]
MKHARTLKFIFLLSLAIIVIGFLGFLTINVKGQDQSATDLSERLKLKGVPIKDIIVTNRLPYQVDIVIQSTSENSALSMDDVWYMQLTRREATLAYRIGMKLNNYTLIVINQKGEKISWEQNFLYPGDLSQNLPPIGQSGLDNTATREILMSKLHFSDMNLDTLRVDSETTPGDYGQIVIIQLSTPSLDTANQHLLPFLGSLSKVLDTINADYGTRVVLCHFRLLDDKGNILLDFVQDVETNQKQWSAIKGLTQEWYSHPQETAAPITETSTPIAYPPQGNSTNNLMPYPSPDSENNIPAYPEP